MNHPIPGKGITPEAAEALGLESTDPRIVIDSDAIEVDEGISDPFPALTVTGAGTPFDVPPVMSSGDSIPDAEIAGNESGDAETRPPDSASPRKRGTRISRTTKATVTPDSEPESRDAKSGPPNLDEWARFFSRIVLKTACRWYLSYAFRGIDEDMLSEREVERLAMTDDERKLISTPMAELSNKSKFMRKHGRTIVASGDAFEAMVVLGAWMARVNRIAAKYKPKQPKIRVNGVSQNGSSGPGMAETNGNPYTNGTTGGRIPDGFPVYRTGSG